MRRKGEGKHRFKIHQLVVVPIRREVVVVLRVVEFLGRVSVGVPVEVAVDIPDRSEVRGPL